MTLKSAIASKLALIRRAPPSWRSLVVLVSVLCFLLLTTTAAVHKHDPAVERASCVLCTVAAEPLADIPPPPAPIEHVALLSYVLVSEQPADAPVCFSAVLPPSCGPPASA